MCPNLVVVGPECLTFLSENRRGGSWDEVRALEIQDGDLGQHGGGVDQLDAPLGSHNLLGEVDGLSLAEIDELEVAFESVAPLVDDLDEGLLLVVLSVQ
jgi:hypothetical protein